MPQAQGFSSNHNAFFFVPAKWIAPYQAHCVNQFAHDELCSDEIRYLNHTHTHTKKIKKNAVTVITLLHLISKNGGFLSSPLLSAYS